MTSKKPKATDAEIEHLFDDIVSTTQAPAAAKPIIAKPPAAKPAVAADNDPLAGLSDLVTNKDFSRPHTPRSRDQYGLVRGSPAPRTASAHPSPDGPVAAIVTTAAPSPGPTGAAIPPITRPSIDSNRSYRIGSSTTPAPAVAEIPSRSELSYLDAQDESSVTNSSWWDGLLTTASTAMKQAEAVVKEMQQNEEAKRWADQVRGNVGALRGLGQRALPTFTDILHTIAPPISSHERLLIHIVHDMVGYPSLDPLVHAVFARVMSQVEGGDLLVIHRGRHDSIHGPRRHPSDSLAGWHDGPWWRQADVPRELGLVAGLAEGTKLCRAGAETLAADYFAATGGIEAARLRATEVLSESNPVRTSDLFLSIQPVSHRSGPPALFASSTVTTPHADPGASAHDDDNLATFAVFVLDPVHEINYGAVSQAIPARWLRWLDAPVAHSPSAAAAAADPDSAAASPSLALLPDEVHELVETTGADPREWVAEWVEETLNLVVGIVAQRYVARRMGVGEGGLGKGKMRAEDIVQDGAGEAARAGLI